MIRKALRFCAVGAFVFGIDFGALWVLQHALPRLTAVSTAYFIAVAAHFCLNKWWVFEARTQFSGAELARYAVTVVACWLCTIVIVALALHFATSNVFVAKGVALPPATALGFVLMRSFVFR